jgi:hypothetical protein
MNSSPQTKQINLTVEKMEASLLETSFIEVVAPSIIKGLIASDHLFNEYDTSIYTQEIASQLYENEQKQLSAYLDLYDKKRMLSKSAIFVQGMDLGVCIQGNL